MKFTISRNGNLLPILFLYLVVAICVRGDSYENKERADIQAITLAIWQYADQNHKLPVSWQELRSVVDLDDSDLPKRYDFGRTTQRSPTLGDSELILVGKAPASLAHERQLGRFLIFRKKSGNFEFEWFEESKCQQVLKEARFRPASLSPDSIPRSDHPASRPDE